MQTAYSRVTVVTAERSVDLALPTALPLGEILPQLVKYAAPSNGAPAPTSWALSRLGGGQLTFSQTLAEAAVHDGDVLELRPEGEAVRPVMVDDVRDAVEDSVDAAGGGWGTSTTGSFAVLAGSVVLGVLAAVISTAYLMTNASWPMRLDSLPTGVAALLTLMFSAWWGSIRAREVDVQIVTAVAMSWGAILALGVCHRLEVEGWSTAFACATAATAVAGVTRLLTPATTGHVAFGAMLLVVTVAMLIAQTSEVAERTAPRLVPVVALVAIGVIPRVSLSVGGLASADYRVRNVGVLDLAALQARYRISNATLVGSVVAISLTVAWFGAGLALSGDDWDRTLSGALGLGLLLRSRVFSRTQHMAPMRVAGLVLAVVALGRLALDHDALVPWVGLIAALVMLAGVGLASMDLSEIPRARVKRTLNVIEFLMLIVILVLFFGALAAYGQFEGIFE